MKWILRTLFSIHFVILLDGCAPNAGFGEFGQRYALQGSGQYGQLAKHIEGQIKDLSSASVIDLEPLCQSYAELKRYSKLFACLDQVERKLEGDPDWFHGPELSFLAAQLRAEAYLDLGNYKEAAKQAQKAYNIRKGLDAPNLASEVKSLSQLALAHALNGERIEALALVGRIEAFDETKVPNVAIQKPFEVLSTYLALGEHKKCLNLMPEAQDSLRGLEDLEKSIKSFGGIDSVLSDITRKRFVISKCHYEAGKTKEAKAGYDELLRHLEVVDQGGLYWTLLFDRGKIAEAEGYHKEAVDFYKRAIEVIERQRSTINTEASRIGFVGDKQQVYHRLVAALIVDEQPAQAFEYVERAKARALVDLLASKQDFATSGAAPQQVAALVKDWDQFEEDSRVPAASSEESGRRSARGVQVRANIRTASPELASLVMVTETASSAIQALLEPDETLLEYYYQGDDLYAFVVTRNRVQGVKLNGANLAKEVESFRKALEDPKSDRVGEYSLNLYGRLIKPVVPQVTTKRLLLVGHGVLHYLPFAALSDGTGYLVDRYSLRLLPSASVLQFLKGRQAQKGESLLAFGNPDLGDAQYDLKFAQDEVQAIAKSFPNAKVLVRQEATKSAFRSLGPQFSYLHLATHGKFDPDAPLKSGLLLAKDAQGDGFLSLGDLYSLRLNADLVTLSACETGLGKLHNGDDVVGLTRGFLYAGSSSIVASLWEVDDRATSLLMTEFYANLKKGDKREALRQAQLTTKKQYPHPFYWAAFQLTGLP